MKNITKSLLLAAISIVVASCNKKDLIDFDDQYVSHIEVFSELGGRVDWNVVTNKIVMDQPNDGRWDTFICNADKSELNNLTSDMNGQAYGDQTVQSWQHRGQPAFSPNGELILFQVMNEHASNPPVTEELLSLGVNNDLWIMKSDGTQKQKLTNNPVGYAVLHPHFSHDGNRIIWAERYNDHPNSSIFGSWRIKVADIDVDLNGEATLSNLSSIQPNGAKWHESHGFSWNDEQIYLSGNLTTEFKASDIYAYTLSDGLLQNLSNSPATWEEMHNSHPQDAQTYSFISSRFFDWNNNLGWATLRTELYINDNDAVKQLTYYNQLTRDNHQNLSSTHYFIGDHCWSPDGNVILAVLAEAKLGNTNSKIIQVHLK